MDLFRVVIARCSPLLISLLPAGAGVQAGDGATDTAIARIIKGTDAGKTLLDDYAPFDLLGGALHIQISDRLLLELQLLDLLLALPSPGGHVALPSAPELHASPSTP